FSLLGRSGTRSIAFKAGVRSNTLVLRPVYLNRGDREGACCGQRDHGGSRHRTALWQSGHSRTRRWQAGRGWRYDRITSLTGLIPRGLELPLGAFSDKTQRAYIRHFEAFASFLGRSPDPATGDDIRRFQFAQVEQGAQPPKMNTQASALMAGVAGGQAAMQH